MKLAFCLFRYYPFGGLERDFLRIAMEAQKRGHSITVYTMGWEGEIPDGFSVIIVPANGFGNHARCLSFIKNLGRYFRKQAFDLVVGFNRMPGLDVYYAADTCYRAKCKKYGSWYRLLPRNRAYQKLERAVFNPEAKTKILLLNPAEESTYQKYYGTSANRFYLLPPGIDRKRIASERRFTIRRQLRQEFNIDMDKHLLLMVGSDFRRKGVDRALNALAALPEIVRSQTVLMIIGNGKPKTLLALATVLGIRQQVLFLGARHDVGRFMLAADLLLHPAYYEAAGLVLLEALVSELPVLVTENCGYAFHLAKANAGLIVPMPFQQKNLNQYLLQMLTTTHTTWKENAKRYAANTDLYSLPERTVELLEQFYQEKMALDLSELKQTNCVIFDSRLKKIWRNNDIFSQVFNTQGVIYRHEKNRKTLRFLVDDKGYFIKLHKGVGWREIFKNLFQGRLPVLGAQQEWRAIQRLKEIGVLTMNLMAYGKRGWNPAELQSFVVTEELVNTVTLEDYCRDWAKQPPPFKLKRTLIAEVAKIAQMIHSHGINHRDFYICHFRWDMKLDPLRIFLIDLHRMQLHTKVPRRWLVRDIGALYFSSMDLGLSLRDFYWFIKKYTSKPLKQVFKENLRFWRQVDRRANKLYTKVNQAKSKALCDR